MFYWGGYICHLICHLLCLISVLTVGIYKKLPFAILWGVDLPVDLPQLWVGIYQYESQIAIFFGGRSAIRSVTWSAWVLSSNLSVWISNCHFLWGVGLPVDLPLDLPNISSQSRNLLEIAICCFIGGYICQCICHLICLISVFAVGIY